VAKTFKGYSPANLRRIYSLMAVSRRLDDKMLILLRQGKAFFHIGCSGQEAAQVAAGENLKHGLDWSYPYYRDQAFVLTMGVTPQELLLQFLARRDDPSSAGRQMPQHYGHHEHLIVSQSSPTGTQFLQAVGTAMALQRDANGGLVYVSAGDGTTSQGEFHEALNWASREKLPVLFHIEDNAYAISVPKTQQTAEGAIFDMVGGYKYLKRFAVDGTDFFAARDTFRAATRHIRSGKGPAIVISQVVRLLSHSSSDDQRKYRPPEEIAKDKARDPLLRFRETCLANRILSEKDFQKLDEEAAEIVSQAADWAEAQPEPDPAEAVTHIYFEDNQPSEPPTEPTSAGPEVVMVDAINHALREELERNEKLVIYGEDVADPKGGVFTATKGLSSAFGEERVFNSPLAEASIVGTAIGLAVAGYKPVVEIQFGDYIWPAMMQLRNELAPMRYRSAGTFSAPVVVRVPVGGYIHGGLCHSQSIEGFFMHLPGVRIAYPSNAADAKGLLKTACRGQDPVLFLEHKGMYRQGFAKRPEPDADYLLPFGQAAVVQSGTDLTIVTYGMLVHKSQQAAKQLADEQGASIEIIDLRTLNPLDMETIGQSVAKTGKVLVAYEDTFTAGPGAEIAARIAQEFFEELDGPVTRIAAKDSPIPYSPVLEKVVLPQTEDILQAARELLAY